MRTGGISTHLRLGGAPLAGVPHVTQTKRLDRKKQKDWKEKKIEVFVTLECHTFVARGWREGCDSLHRLVVDSSALCRHLGNKRFYREPSTSAAKKEMKRSYSGLLEFPPEFGCFQLIFVLEARCPPREPGVSCRIGLRAHPKDGTELSCNRKANARTTRIARD